MRNVEKFSQADAILAVTNIRNAEKSASEFRALAEAQNDKTLKNALVSLAKRHDTDAEYLADRLFRRFERRAIGENRESFLKIVESNLALFPEAESK